MASASCSHAAEEDIASGTDFSREDQVRSLETLARLLGSGEPLEAAEAEAAVDLMSRVPAGRFQRYVGQPLDFMMAWNEQRDLFKGLPKELPLEESYYKEWTSDPSHPLAGQKGLVRGDPASHMVSVLDGFGMVLSPDDPRSPDNLAVLLEFLAFLVETRPIEEAAAFCGDHLDWLPDLRKEAAARGIQGVFHEMVHTVESVVKHITSIREMGD
jgi:TorA maturation chaperone TorD